MKKKVLLIIFLIISNLFADRVQVESFVERFYQTVLNRHSDIGGLNSWTDQLISGKKAGADIARGFIFSPEFINRNTTNDEYITILYKAFFNREPDIGGFNNWKNELNSGKSRDFILNGFLFSTEFSNLCKVYNIQPITPAPIVNTPAKIIIHNDSKSVDSITQIYLTKTEITTWNENLIDFKIEPGYYISNPFNIYECNTKYDIKVVYQNNKDIIYKDIYLKCGEKYDRYFTLYQSTIPEENIDCSQKGQNKMLYDIMKDRYLWYQYTPDLDYQSYNNLDRLLYDLKYKKYDRWSYIQATEAYNDYYERGEYGGTGYSTDYFNNRVYIRYVYKNSPAGKAGLKRGVEILAINGKTIKEIEDNNLWSTINGKDIKGVKVNLKVKMNSVVKNITLVKDTVHMKTVMQDKIFNINNKKIGYLLFNKFIEPSRDELKVVFQKFKQENIDELILDLRYNGGGRLDVARYLASLIGGERTVDNIFETLKYNDRFSHWNKEYKFTQEKQSLGLDRIYILTTYSTASASESVINGLKPFLDVYTVGYKTDGKPVGMNGIDFCNKHVAPITFKVVNALEEGDYFNGIETTCRAIDDLRKPFGDLNETMLKEALYLINNRKCSSTNSKQSKIMEKIMDSDNKKQDKMYQGFRREIGSF